MGLKFRRGSTAQQSGSLAFGEPYVNTTLGTLVVGGATGDIVLSAAGTGSTGNFGAISGSGLDITGNANIAGNLSVGGQLTIGDNTSDTINVVASLSSSLIPQTTNVFDLGSASKIWRDLYISTGSIKFVDGTTVVKELTLATITGLESATGSSNVSITNLNTTTASLNTSVSNLNTFSSSALTRLTALEVETANLESFSGSQLTQNSTLATITGSLISSASNLTQRVAANEAVSGTFARTNSTNIFTGNQTVSGSLTVTQDLTVLGSASIQNISSSNLVIGAAYVTLNTATPSSRYAGLQIVDSGSSGGSGSFLYDAVQDEFIFIHRGNGTNITSSHFVLGPETYDNLGNETYLTNNRLSKGTGKEHLVDSNITDDGTLITLGSNTTITGTLVASGTTLVSSSAQVIGILSSLNTYTGSNDTTNTTQTSRLDQLSTASGSAITRLTALEVETANLETFSGSALTRLTALEVETSNLETFTASLSTTSNVRFGSLGIGMAASGTSGRIDAANDVVAFSTSDIRLKENIKPIENALDKISKISGNTYDWKSELKDAHGYEGNDVGVIAQEIEAVLPQLVQDRDNGYKAVKYDKIVALLIEGIKEQQTQIHSLTLEIEKLKEQKGL
jgi:hypothetical protein